MLGLELAALFLATTYTTVTLLKLTKGVKQKIKFNQHLNQLEMQQKEENVEKEQHIRYVEQMNQIKKTITEIYFYGKQVENREIKQKIYRGLMIVEQIYTNLEKKPDEIKKMERFSTYYLTLFLKLVKNQLELTEQNIPLEQIKKTLAEIEKGLVQLTVAFKYILGQTLSEKLMDIETDIAVLDKLEESVGQK